MTIQTPLAQTIVDEPFLKHVKLPTFKIYDGTTDPEEHLHYYKDQMIVFSCSDVIVCKVFARRLKKATHGCYHQLLNSSITCFNELTKAF